MRVKGWKRPAANAARRPGVDSVRVAARTPARGGLSSTTALCGLLGATLLAHAFGGTASAANLPEGGTVAAGSASIGQAGQSLTVTQTSDRAVINWQSFSIGADAQVRFQQPSSNSITLNRVTGNERSDILGTLSANGSVWLLNPNGILFGSTARVDTAGLVATTSNIADSDFMAGKHVFDKVPGSIGSVVNEGEITIRGGGLAALVAPSVRNSGVIAANLGRVALAAGEAFTLDFYGDSLVQFAIPAGASPSVDVMNSGAIRADGGRVQISAATAAGIVSGVVNMTGIVEARRVGVQGGEIVLDGGEAGAVTVAGTLDASGRDAGERGGTVKVLGDQVALTGSATLDASGDAGGGTVLVGGNYQGKGPERNARTTTIAAGATLKADAVTNGNGGTVVAWADGNTRFDGRITARGGAQGGNGGLIETSGKAGLSVGATAVVDASAPAGQGGTWLLDPTNLTIKDSGSTNAADLEADGEQFVDASVIETSLHNNTAVTLQALNTITIDEDINGNSGAAGANSDLTLDAKTVNLNAAITLHSSATLSGNATQVNVGSGGRIQNGVDVAADGATVNVAAGTYNENVTINKVLTLLGANAGVDGRSGARGSESVMSGTTTISGGKVVVDGFKFFDDSANTNYRAIVLTDLSGVPEIRNSVFERTGAGNAANNQRGIEISQSNVGGVIIERNLFTSDEVNVYLNRGWRSAIYTNGGNNSTVIRDNVFENSRTAINFDNFTAAFTITGNVFRNNGTANSFGGTSQTNGEFIITGNDYSRNDADFNLSNVATTFRLDASGNTFNGQAASLLSRTELFALEDRIYHGVDGGSKRGLVTVVANNVYVTRNSGSIQRGIGYVAEGGTVNVAAGTYAESLSITKELTLDGAGAGQTIIDPTAGNGITVSGAIGDDKTVAINNLTVQGGANGILVADGTDLGRISLDGVVVRDNASNGFITNNGGSQPSTVVNVIITNAVFEGNGFGGGSADINLFRFNGNATLTNVDILGTRSADVASATDYGLQIRGHGEVGGTPAMKAAGNVTLNDVRIAGTYRRAHLGIQRYSDASNISMNGVRIGGALSANTGDGTISVASSTGGWAGLFFSDMAGSLDIGNTHFDNMTVTAPWGGHIAMGQATKGLVVDATAATFFGTNRANGLSQAERLAIENRITHVVDDPTLGRVIFTSVPPRIDLPSQAPPTPPGLSNQTPPPPPSPGANPGGVAFNGDLTSQPVANVFGQGFGLGLGGPPAAPPGQGSQGGPTITGNPVPSGNIVSGAPEPVGRPSGPSGQGDAPANRANQYANSLLDNFSVGSGGSNNDSE